MTAVDFTGTRYDMGNKLGIMQAQVEVALNHPRDRRRVPGLSEGNCKGTVRKNALFREFSLDLAFFYGIITLLTRSAASQRLIFVVNKSGLDNAAPRETILAPF